MSNRNAWLCLTLIVLIVLPGALAFGQTGKIAGQVTDAETNEPLPGVNVILEGTEQGAATDANGEYYIINVTPSTYSLTASMVGYQQMTKTGVEVTINHTTPINFSLEQTVIAGEPVTVEAQREIIKMDMSASTESTDPEEIQQTPMVTDINEMVNLQAGVEGGSIRGGGADQIAYIQDGLMLVDNRANKPMLNMVNLSQVQSMEVIKGGFNAEYGNVRSGVISVVTKEGSPANYSASIDIRYTPPRFKHSGYPVYDPRNYNVRAFLDPAVRYVGTRNGDWDTDTQNQNIVFEGWNAISDRMGVPADTLINYFIWQHMLHGYAPWGLPSAQGLGRSQMLEYGNKPDYLIDGSLGGPVPLIGKYLGNLTFFASHRNNHQLFSLPIAGKSDRNYFRQQNTSLKLTSRITDNLKLQVEGSYGAIQSKSQEHRGGFGPDSFLKSDMDPIWQDLGSGTWNYTWADGLNPFDVFSSTFGLSLDHTLSPKTFYKLRVSAINVQNREPGPVDGIGLYGTQSSAYPDYLWRDMNTLRYFGSLAANEAPLGFRYQEGPASTIASGYDMAATGGKPRDFSRNRTYDIKFDLTSQVHPNHMIQTGFLINYDEMHTDLRLLEQYLPDISTRQRWSQFPIRAGAYIQDKFEFQGMIMNVGVRADYADPNSAWYNVDPYSNWFTVRKPQEFFDNAPNKAAKSRLKISPRLGISHPISERSKFYFNYGHFYSMAPSWDLYRIETDPVSGVDILGNASADLPRTIAYELGYEINAFDLFLLSFAGYYKDITAQTGWVAYTNYDASVDYQTVENNNFQDIRGFEIRINKNRGQWLTGWANYNYRVEQSGYVGRQHYFQDQRQQRLEGLQNPDLEPSLAKPVFRVNVILHTPFSFGPALSGIKPLGGWNLSLLYTHEAGDYFTWDPLDTYKLQDNLQWRPYRRLDMRLSYNHRLPNANLRLYLDVQNLLNINNLRDASFASGADREDYLKSLHLPLYEDQDYQDQGWDPGSDRPGDINSSSRDYINMPNLDHLWYTDLRYFTYGIAIDF